MPSKLDIFGAGSVPGKFPKILKLSFRNRKFSPGHPAALIENYGTHAKINDTIGVLLEFKEGVGSLSFYRNEVRYC